MADRQVGLSAGWFAMLVTVAFGTGGVIHHSLAGQVKAIAARLSGALAYALSPIALNLTIFSVLVCLLAFGYRPTPEDANFVVALCIGFGVIYAVFIALHGVLNALIFPWALMETISGPVMRDCPVPDFLQPVAERPPRFRR